MLFWDEQWDYSAGSKTWSLLSVLVLTFFNIFLLPVSCVKGRTVEAGSPGHLRLSRWKEGRMQGQKLSTHYLELVINKLFVTVCME